MGRGMSGYERRKRITRFLSIAGRGNRVVLALFLAVITWSFAVGVEEGIYTISVNVRVTGYSPNLVLTEGTIRKVRVTVRGPLYRLKAYQAFSPEIEVAIEQSTPGDRTIKLTNSHFDFLREMTIQEIQPREIQMVFVRKARKNVRVIADLRGQPEPEFEVKSVQVVPSRIRIAGPEQMLESIEAVKTFPVQVSGTRSPFENNIQLVSPGDYVDMGRESVRVIVNVVEKRRRGSLRLPLGIISDTGVVLQGVTRPDTVTVVIEGPATRFEKLSRDTLKAFIRISDAWENAGVAPVIISGVPAGFMIIEVAPAEAGVSGTTNKPGGHK